jgi:type II secretory pathway pseudopilin PulG
MRRRHGFTIVELLVSMALIIFIMALLAEAFTAGLESFRNLKAIGDMQEKMRSVSMILRKDLAYNHFDTGNSYGPRLSDQDPRATNWTPPARGFFRIWQGTAASASGAPPLPTQFYYLEGYDDNPGGGIPSYRATDQILHFTVKLSGNRPENYLWARVPTSAYGPPFSPPPGWPLTNYVPPAFDLYTTPDGPEPAATYMSQWAEVAYFLRSTGQSAGGIPLYALYRRQRLAVPRSTSSTTPNSLNSSNRQAVDANYFEVSCNPDPKASTKEYFNAAEDLTIPERRFAANPDPNSRGLWPTNYQPWNYPTLADEMSAATPPNPLVGGDDLLLTNVISFEIKALWDTNNPPAPLGNGQPKGGVDFQGLDVAGDPNLNQNPVYKTAGVYVFDTWSNTLDSTYPNYNTQWNTNPPTPYHIPAKIRIRALQITLRVWDLKTKQARQITLVQDM